MQPVLPGEEFSPSLALVNSRHPSRAGLVDHITSTREATRWLARRNLLPPRTAITEAELEAFRLLRKATYKLFRARIDGVAPASDAVALLNVVAGAVGQVTLLTWSARAGPSVTLEPNGGRPLEQALAAIARDAMDAVCEERGEALLECEAPGCVRMLTKDHSRRRWCSTACGDRVRAARYYARHRPIPRPSM